MSGTGLVSYKVRSSNSFPIQGGNLIFTFGTECQQVIFNECASTILTSRDMCMLGGNYYSATYKAYPGSIGGQLVFSATEASRPVYTGQYGSSECTGLGGGGGGANVV